MPVRFRRQKQTHVSEHTVEEACYLNRGLPQFQRVIICSCGFMAEGDTWQEAGEAYDVHLEKTETET